MNNAETIYLLLLVFSWFTGIGLFFIGKYIGTLQSTLAFNAAVETQKQKAIQHIIDNLTTGPNYVSTSTADMVTNNIDSKKEQILWYKRQIQEALEKEDFETAAILRDELNKLVNNG